MGTYFVSIPKKQFSKLAKIKEALTSKCPDFKRAQVPYVSHKAIDVSPLHG